VLNDQPYAYPYATLFSNPVIVQSQREKRMLLMWSAFANAATALEVSREVKGRDLEVVSDPADSLLVYDSRNGQFLVALTGEPPGGGKMDGIDGALRAVKDPWGRWVAEHPDTKVLALAGSGPKAPVLPHPLPGPAPTTAPAIASSAPSVPRLVVLIGEDPPLAIPADQIGAAPLNATAGDVPVLLFRDPKTGRVRAFDRHVEEDLIPTFSAANGSAKHKHAFLVDSDTGSGWSAGGVAVDGDKALKGKRLKPVEVREDVYLGPARFWFGKLTLYGGEATAAPALPAQESAPPAREGRADAHRPDQASPGAGLEDRKPAAQHRGRRSRPSPPRSARPRPKQR
jgi:hypothetical protein